MATDFRRWRDAANAARNNLVSGPWRASDWYPGGGPSWDKWRPFSGIILTIEESLVETKVIERGPDYSAGPRSRQVDVGTKTYLFTAAVTGENIWRGDPLEVPPGMSYWRHSSATAWGHGLYDAQGSIHVRGVTETTRHLQSTYTPADGGESETTVYEDVHLVDEDDSQTMIYTSDSAAIAGLTTPCRMTVAQILHGPGGSFEFAYPGGQLLFPEELDPDGNPGSEVYFTDTALATLASGGWSAGMVMGGGSLTGSYPPNLGGIDNGDYWEHSYTRSGLLTLTFT